MNTPYPPLACQTIRNSAFRQDFLKARHTLDQNGSFADAFEQLTLLEDEYKGLIATGSVGGQLDQSLTQLVATMTQQLEFKLQIFNNVFQRMVSYSVAMCIVGTARICTAS